MHAQNFQVLLPMSDHRDPPPHSPLYTLAISNTFVHDINCCRVSTNHKSNEWSVCGNYFWRQHHLHMFSGQWQYSSLGGGEVSDTQQQSVHGLCRSWCCHQPCWYTECCVNNHRHAIFQDEQQGDPCAVPGQSGYQQHRGRDPQNHHIW